MGIGRGQVVTVSREVAWWARCGDMLVAEGEPDRLGFVDLRAGQDRRLTLHASVLVPWRRKGSLFLLDPDDCKSCGDGRGSLVLLDGQPTERPRGRGWARCTACWTDQWAVVERSG